MMHLSRTHHISFHRPGRASTQGVASIFNYNAGARSLARSGSNRSAPSSRVQRCWEPERMQALSTASSLSNSRPLRVGRYRYRGSPRSENAAARLRWHNTERLIDPGENIHGQQSMGAAQFPFHTRVWAHSSALYC